MQVRLTAVLGATMLLGGSALAAADTITITSDQRHIPTLSHVSDSSGDSFKFEDGDVPSDHMQVTLLSSTGTSVGNATTRLDSSFADPAHMSGTGSASVTWSADFADMGSEANYDVFFFLPTSYAFDFSGQFQANAAAEGGDQFGFTRGQWSAALTGGGHSLFQDSDQQTNGNASSSRSHTGVLDPGTYQLVVDSAAYGTFSPPTLTTGAAGGSFAFTFDLRPVDNPVGAPTPEPASLLLLGTGAFGVLRRSWRPR